MNHTTTSATFNKTFKAVSNISDLSTLQGFKSFKVLKKSTASVPAQHEQYFVVHKSSTNFKDRVKIIACSSCDAITVENNLKCSCSTVH